jgi:DNA gyrase/topoisomerase IV subunit B
MHGVGLFPVNALSSWLVLEVFSERRHYAQRFELGIPTTKMLDTGTAERSGTRITFAPDPSIFTSTWVDPGMVARRLRELSWLLPGLTLEFHDSQRHRFHQLDGLQGFLQANKPGTSETLLVDGSIGEIRVEAAARWHAYPWSTIESFANIERTTEGGTHVRGMLAGLAQGLRTAAPDACRHNRSKQLENVISQGLDAVVCIRLNDPKYGGPTRNRLVTPAAETAVKKCVSKAFATFVREHQSLLQRFVAALGVAG